MESLDRPFEREPVRHQRLQVNQAARDETQRFGVLVGVAVLELQVDLVCREVAEGETLFRRADANDEDFATEHY